MKKNVKRLFVEEGKLNIRGLEKAISKGWIVEKDKEDMIESKGEEICSILNLS